MNPLPRLRTVEMVSPATPPGAPAVVPPTPLPGLAQPFDPVLNVPRLPAIARYLFHELLGLGLLDRVSVESFLSKHHDKLASLTTRERAGSALVHAGLLTAYQRDRVLGGRTHGLILGAYRVLDRIGGGTVGVVFVGEHRLLRRRVAIKVLPVDDDVTPNVIDRFNAETQILAALDNPHVVTAYDAGVVPSPGGNEPTLHYLVLEVVPGGDLEQHVCTHGLPPLWQVAEWGRQAACGLQAAHDRHLIHRDMKPSNLLLTAERRVKIVDFGLARQLCSSITRPGSLIGSVDFMSPEQSVDATAVSAAADVYGLGSSLFWVLTGELPIPRADSLIESIRALATSRPRCIRELRSEVPEALEKLLARMLARDPAQRPTALEAMQELAAFASEGGAPASAATATGNERLTETIGQLEASLRSRNDDVRRAHDAVLFSLAKMAGSHGGETEGHLGRMQQYVRILADRLKRNPDWSLLTDSNYIEELVRCVPLHDIGKVAVPDAILEKPAALASDEWEAVRAHPVAGCEVLDALAREHGESLPFLSVARAIVRHHHERWDGDGYPDHLAGKAIPLPARLAALADVYDSLRRDRPYRPGLPHAQATLAILGSSGQFDPAVVAAFQATETQFEDVFETIAN